jgi:hypothetical protein
VFAYTVSPQMQVPLYRRLAGDAVWVPEEPPLWSAVGIAAGTEPVPITFPGPGVDTARVLGIEVADGHAIRYEIQPLGPRASNARTPGEVSRKMSGFEFIVWTPGATFAFVDASSYPA